MGELAQPATQASPVSDIQPWMLINCSGYMNAGRIEDVSLMVPDASWSGGSRRRSRLRGVAAVLRAKDPRQRDLLCRAHLHPRLRAGIRPSRSPCENSTIRLVWRCAASARTSGLAAIAPGKGSYTFGATAQSLEGSHLPDRSLRPRRRAAELAGVSCSRRYSYTVPPTTPGWSALEACRVGGRGGGGAGVGVAGIGVGGGLVCRLDDRGRLSVCGGWSGGTAALSRWYGRDVQVERRQRLPRRY